MEGLTAFVSRFDKSKPEDTSAIQVDAKAGREQDNGPAAASSSLVTLPFSIAEILSDKRNEPRSKETEDTSNEMRRYAAQGKGKNKAKKLLTSLFTVSFCYLTQGQTIY